MAFVRWRGNSAALLITVYEKGRSRQVLLAALDCGYRVPAGIQAYVNEHFPDVFVDWNRVNQAMAQGPSSAAPLTQETNDLCRDGAESALMGEKGHHFAKREGIIAHGRRNTIRLAMPIRFRGHRRRTATIMNRFLLRDKQSHGS